MFKLPEDQRNENEVRIAFPYQICHDTFDKTHCWQICGKVYSTIEY